LKGKLGFVRPFAATIRDIFIDAQGGSLAFESVARVEITSCLGSGMAKETFIRLTEVERSIIDKNQFRLRRADAKPSTEIVFKDDAKYAKLYRKSGDIAFRNEAQELITDLASAPVGERKEFSNRIVFNLRGAADALSSRETAAYQRLAKVVASEELDPTLVKAALGELELTAVDATTGSLITYSELQGSHSLIDNQLSGTVSFGGLPSENPLNADELAKLDSIIKTGAIVFDGQGEFTLRGNQLTQATLGEELAKAVREIVKKNQGTVPAFRNAKWTDNTFSDSKQAITAVRFGLTSNHFEAGENLIGFGVCFTGTYAANQAAGKQSLWNHVSPTPPQVAANASLAIV
jgi:hypothetical protein